MRELVALVERDIGMDFGLNKCAVLSLKGGVNVRCDGFELSVM